MASSNVISRQLGKDGPIGASKEVLLSLSHFNNIFSVSLGFGAMGLSAFYGTLPSDKENHELIKLVSAVTHSNTSIYHFVIL